MPFFLRLQGQPEAIEFLTINELASLCGRKKNSFLRLTESGKFPEANYRTPKAQIKAGKRQGQWIAGKRLYSKEFLVPKIVEFWKKNIKRGLRITIEQRSELMTMFEKEVEYYSS